MAPKRDTSGKENPTSASKRMAVAPAPAVLGPVNALVLGRVSRESNEATVLFETQGYEQAVGVPVKAVAELTDTVASHVAKYHSNFVFDGEPLVYASDPRADGNPADHPKSTAKRLDIDMLDHYISGDEDLEFTRRGNEGKEHSYFVLVTRKLNARRPAMTIVGGPSSVLQSNGS